MRVRIGVRTGLGTWGMGGGIHHDASRPPPLIEHVEHVGIAEIDLHRPPARPLAIVPLEVPVDAFVGDFDGHAPRGPTTDEVKRGTDDPNHVAIVLLTEVGLQFATVVCNRQSGIRNLGRLVAFPHDPQALKRQIRVHVLDQ